jgi:hypothetical protein
MARDSDSNVPSRRTVLKGAAGAVGAATIPTTGSADDSTSALDQRRELLAARRTLTRKYENDDLRDVIRREGAAVLEQLHEADYINSADLSDFETGLPDERASDAQRVDGGVALSVDRDEKTGETTTSLWAVAKQSDYEVLLHVQPEVDRQRAIVRRDGSHVALVRPDGVTDQAVTTQSSCDMCYTSCGPYYITYLSGDGTGCDCGTREPTCDECPDMNKCDSGGGFW